MCFSATANFVGSGVIGGVGVATLCRVRSAREAPFAALPLLFALHQVIEGFVWLGLDGTLSSSVLRGAAAAYVLYAQGLLPLLVPWAIWALEVQPRYRRRMIPFVALGALLSLYTLWALTAYDTRVYVRGHSIVYDNPGTEHGLLAVPYVLATCGAMFFSGYRYIVWFGVLNAIGVVVAMWIKARAFTSIWCAYAAVVSVVIYGHFRRERRRRPQPYAGATA